MHFMILLNNVCPHNIALECWEFSLNMNLLVQISKHPIVIYEGQ